MIGLFHCKHLEKWSCTVHKTISSVLHTYL